VVALRWELYSYFKSSFDLHVLRELTAGKMSNLLIWVNPGAFAWALVGLLVAVALLIPARLLRKHGHRVTPTRITRRQVGFLAIGWAVLVINHFAIVPLESLRFGLSNKMSFFAIDWALSAATDFDRDGFGPLTVPRDPNNFNASINAYAAEKAGDGIDQDALAGDLPALDPIADRPAFAAVGHAAAPRNAIVVVVETFRPHVVEEPEVMPFLSALAKASPSAAYNPYMYSNYGVTSRAIQTVLFGSLHYTARSKSLFTAFREAGYLTFAVSAQSETWGNTAGLLQFDKLDRYYDTRSKTWDPGKLTPFQKRNKEFALFLDSREVNGQIFSMIDGRGGRPFMMYVNYQDLHYPYCNDKVEKVFAQSCHDEASFFRPENRAAILSQYRNAAHHLDGAFRELFEGLRTRGLGENTVVAIVGDHPDSFYENGITGHAWTLDEHQRRTPFIVVNGKGSQHTPMGQDEIARVVVESVNTGSEGTPLVFAPEPRKRVFELTGTLEAPRQIGFIMPGELLEYDFKTDLWKAAAGSYVHGAAAPTTGPRKDEFVQLIRRWESERILRTGEGPTAAVAGEP
jgi:phosphoglycerol transferase MdoB-like AlkP superfamily enzyme